MHPSLLVPPALLAASNPFRNVAWYAPPHRAPSRALWLSMLVSWGIAFFECCLAAPANPIGAGTYLPVEQKTLQAAMALSPVVLVAWCLFGTQAGPSTAAGAFLGFKAAFG